MLLLSPSSASLLSLQSHSYHVGSSRSRGLHQPLKVAGMAKETTDGGTGVVEKVAIAGGLVSTPVIAWSLYTLKTTGCGLPPGPGGSVGALEGVSYLAVVGIIGWSLYTKAKTGSGLPRWTFWVAGSCGGSVVLVIACHFSSLWIAIPRQGFHSRASSR
ncbi:hypothetical protein OIU85_009108 [Salix viminalis]|uniref:Uncharacterized protein n=1 Tax=Salix viminalis TaxID=40686 RepID=A0A9Q0SIT9_SALVM|nr:hypothetical protein OIU85_009108 [Salix viminalis]